MGGISAQTGKRQGEAGAIVFGGVRDIADPAVSATPCGRRTNAVTVNGASKRSRSTVRSRSPAFESSGRFVFADDTGVCFIPRERAAEVLELAKQISAAEEAKCGAIHAGVPVADLPA